MKVARGRSWQPEIGMEHASRGRRSGNKGVGARWRGRFRIFSARHCSRTEVSHAENSGMTMLFFSLEDCSGVGGGFFHHALERLHSRGRATTEWMARGAVAVFVLRVCCASMCWPVDRPGPRMPPQERQHEGLGGLFHMLWRDATSINALCFKRFVRRKRRILRRRRALFRRTTRHPLWRRRPRM